MRSAAPEMALPLRDAFTRRGLWAAVLVMFAMSGGMLWYLGYNYDGFFGNPATKIHPFTYMALCLLVWRALATGDPIGYALWLFSRRPATTYLLTVAAFELVATAIRGGPGIGGFADTYIGPCALVFLLLDASAEELESLTRLLHVVMTVNALLGLFEFLSGTLVFPYRLDGETFASDTRSAALQGHPLSNASLTAVYVMALMTGAKALSPRARFAMVSLQCAALVVFGGRAAMVTVAVFGVILLFWRVFMGLRSNRVSLPALAVALAMMALLPLAAGAIVSAGYLDKILIRFVSDGGSANARVAMFDLFQYVNIQDLIFGPDTTFIDSIRRIHGLEWGIENPLVRMLLYQGAIVTVLLLGGVVMFARELVRGRESGVGLVLLVSLIQLGTSESISTKTNIMGKIAIIIVCLYRAAPKRRAAFSPNDSRIAASNARVRSSISPMPSKRFQNAQGKPRASAAWRTSEI